MRRKPTTIDEYLAGVPPDQRAALQKLRETIRSVVPDAEECISYGIPAFRLDGRIIGGFSATTKGCSYYPFSGSTLRTLARAVARYDRTKSALHFTPEKPLPETLIRKLIAARRAERRRSGDHGVERRSVPSARQRQRRNREASRRE
jgi:uncharacterized protein YdhG (YjbR/CyaY superfamily)